MKSSTYSLSKDDCRPEERNDGEGAVDDGPGLELNQGRLVISSTGCFFFPLILFFFASHPPGLPMHGAQKIVQPIGVDNRYSLVFNIYTAFSFDKNTINFLKSLIAKDGLHTYSTWVGKNTNFLY